MLGSATLVPVLQLSLKSIPKILDGPSFLLTTSSMLNSNTWMEETNSDHIRGHGERRGNWLWKKKICRTKFRVYFKKCSTRLTPVQWDMICLWLHMHRPTMLLALLSKSNVVNLSCAYLGLLMMHMEMWFLKLRSLWIVWALLKLNAFIFGTWEHSTGFCGNTCPSVLIVESLCKFCMSLSLKDALTESVMQRFLVT